MPKKIGQWAKVYPDRRRDNKDGSKEAEPLEVSRMQLHRVVAGKSAGMAVRLAVVIGSCADMWLRMQSASDLAHVLDSDTNPAKEFKSYTPPSPAPQQPRLV